MNLLHVMKVLRGGICVTGNVQITGTNYIPEIPKQEKVEEKLQEILEISNTTQRAIEYMLYGMRAQLFWDGNKRTSMTLANKILISAGAGILTITDNHMETFNALLLDYYNTGEGEELKRFMYDNAIDGIEL